MGCLRMGCSLSFSYFFQRLHNYCLAEAYSLLEGMSNHIPGRDIFNEPIEMYGIPDQYPLFSLYCKGNINNYRIFTFGNEEQKRNIKGLYYLGNKYQKMDLVERQKDGYENILYSPHFVYDQSSQIVKTFKKKKKEADMFDFSFIELMGYSDDEEKDFNDELNEETDFRDEYIMNDDEVTILEREEEENLPFVESGFFRNFSLCQPKREIAISKWSQIKGPLKNIYNYKPILFNVLDGISRNEIIPPM